MHLDGVGAKCFLYLFFLSVGLYPFLRDFQRQILSFNTKNGRTVALSKIGTLTQKIARLNSKLYNALAALARFILRRSKQLH